MKIAALSCTLLLALVFCDVIQTGSARPTSRFGYPSASNRVLGSRRISRGSPAQHYRTTVKRRYVETEVATKLAEQLAFQQRMKYLREMLKKVNSGAYNHNTKFQQALCSTLRILSRTTCRDLYRKSS